MKTTVHLVRFTTQTNTTMKATKLLLGVVLITGSSVLSFAGPGPEYWARVNPKAQTSYPSRWIKQTDKAPAKVQPVAQIAACDTCCCCAKKA